MRDPPPAPWPWTDDTAMAVEITRLLYRLGGVVQDELAHGFAQRYETDPGRGYGGMAHRTLRAIAQGVPWQEVSRGAFDGEGSMGNGGAMRVAPIGAYFAGEPDAAAEHARASAEVTHAHPDGQAGAVAVAVATASAWEMRARDLADPAVRRELLKQTVDSTPEGLTRSGLIDAAELDFKCEVDDAIYRLGNGSRVVSFDTVPFALWMAARHLNDFAEALWETVRGFGDVDTNCAIVGGVVVMATGVQAIPQDWVDAREPVPRLPE